MEILRHMRPLRGLIAGLAGAALVAASACGGSAQRAAPLRPVAQGVQWPVKTREHVDLWLHSFALLQDDTATVPLFARGYRDALTVIKNSRNLATDLDANRETLAATLAAKPALLGAQFIPLYFGTWEEMVRAFEYFQTAQGDPRRASNPEIQAIVAFLAQSFPTAPDREFARKLMLAITSERDRFHHAWWVEEHRARTAALARADSLWQSRWRPAIQRFLNNTQQGNGDLIPVIALGGEGRAVPAGKNRSQYAVAFPRTTDSAEVMLFSFAHEAAGSVAQVAVNDNLTPIQQREGLGARYSSVGLVRGGALLVERIDPTLAERYAHWYLAQAGKPVPAGGNVMTAFAAAFPMPEEIITSMRRQIEISFGGI
jgi:hypothetical protein